MSYTSFAQASQEEASMAEDNGKYMLWKNLFNHLRLLFSDFFSNFCHYQVIRQNGRGEKFLLIIFFVNMLYKAS